MFKKMVILGSILIFVLGFVTTLETLSGSANAQCSGSKVVSTKSDDCKTSCKTPCQTSCKTQCKTSQCKTSCTTSCKTQCKTSCTTATSAAGKPCCSSACGSSCCSTSDSAVKKISTDMPYRESKRVILAGEYVCGKCSLEKLDTCQGFVKTGDGNLYPLLKSGKLKGLCKSAAAHGDKQYKIVGHVRIINGVKYIDVNKLTDI